MATLSRSMLRRRALKVGLSRTYSKHLRGKVKWNLLASASLQGIIRLPNTLHHENSPPDGLYQWTKRSWPLLSVQFAKQGPQRTCLQKLCEIVLIHGKSEAEFLRTVRRVFERLYLKTDHSNLTFLNVTPTGKVQRWKVYLQDKEFFYLCDVPERKFIS